MMLYRHVVEGNTSHSTGISRIPSGYCENEPLAKPVLKEDIYSES